MESVIDNTVDKVVSEWNNKKDTTFFSSFIKKYPNRTLQTLYNLENEFKDYPGDDWFWNGFYPELLKTNWK